MSIRPFEEAALDDGFDDPHLRWLAGLGARIRQSVLQPVIGPQELVERPRGVLVLGTEARLIRALLEPVCPVPFMAWPGPSLPAWVGPMDLVVAIGGHNASAWEVECAGEAARRGATIIVAAPEDSHLAVAAGSRSTTVIPAPDADPVASALAVLALLEAWGLGPRVHAVSVADAADLVAESCSPYRDLSDNPAKELAIGLAEKTPLIWGGTVLAQRASRRVAEALRRASGRVALAADYEELIPILRAATPADMFSDPLDDGASIPVLLLLDIEQVPQRLRDVPEILTRHAEAVGVRVCQISSGSSIQSSEVERYVTLLQQGRYTAAYLAIGHGTSLAEDEL